MSEISRNKIVCPHCRNEIDLDKEKLWIYEPNDKIDEKCPECRKEFSYEYVISFDITSWKGN